jgi:hypothetical protein
MHFMTINITMKGTKLSVRPKRRPKTIEKVVSVLVNDSGKACRLSSTCLE